LLQQLYFQWEIASLLQEEEETSFFFVEGP
jgi:hypothetical protein